MAITLSTGATVSVAKTYSPALGVAGVSNTALTNANPCVVSSAAHTLTAGDYVVMSSGWGLLDQRVCRVLSVVAATSFTLEGVDTTDTAKYPIGTGTGTHREITVWSQLSQVKGVSASGGAQQFADITSITDTVIRQIPTVKDAVNMTIDVFDDPTLAWYTDVVAADTARAPYGLLMTFPNGSKLVANSYWSIMKVPTMETNQALMTQISLSYAAEPLRYST
jgi:Phage tail tube protein, TTP